MQQWAGEMALWVKAEAAKTADLSLLPRVTQ